MVLLIPLIVPSEWILWKAGDQQLRTVERFRWLPVYVALYWLVLDGVPRLGLGVAPATQWVWAVVHWMVAIAAYQLSGATWAQRRFMLGLEPISTYLGVLLLPAVAAPDWRAAVAYGVAFASVCAVLTHIVLPDHGWAALRQWPGWSRLWQRWLGHRVRGAGAGDKGYVYLVYPHGVAALYSIATFALPGDRTDWPLTHLAVAPIFLTLPLLNVLFKLVGCIPCTPRAIRRAIEQGHNVAILPEGVPGILHAGRDLETRPGLPADRRRGLGMMHRTGWPFRFVVHASEHRTVWRSPLLGGFQAWSTKYLNFLVGSIIGVVLGGDGAGADTTFGLTKQHNPATGESQDVFTARCVDRLVELWDAQERDD